MSQAQENPRNAVNTEETVMPSHDSAWRAFATELGVLVGTVLADQVGSIESVPPALPPSQALDKTSTSRRR